MAKVSKPAKRLQHINDGVETSGVRATSYKIFYMEAGDMKLENGIQSLLLRGGHDVLEMVRLALTSTANKLFSNCDWHSENGTSFGFTGSSVTFLDGS